MNLKDLLDGYRPAPSGLPRQSRHRPQTLDESKMMFRIAVSSAAAGPLSRLTVRRMMMIAFGVGLGLGFFPAARRKLTGIVIRRFTAPPSPSPEPQKKTSANACRR